MCLRCSRRLRCLSSSSSNSNNRNRSRLCPLQAPAQQVTVSLQHRLQAAACLHLPACVHFLASVACRWPPQPPASRLHTSLCACQPSDSLSRPAHLLYGCLQATPSWTCTTPCVPATMHHRWCGARTLRRLLRTGPTTWPTPALSTTQVSSILDNFKLKTQTCWHSWLPSTLGYLSRHCAVAGPGENMATGYNNWNDVIMAFYNEVRNAWPAPAADVTDKGTTFSSHWCLQINSYNFNAPGYSSATGERCP